MPSAKGSEMFWLSRRSIYVICCALFLLTSSSRADEDVHSGNYWLRQCRENGCAAYILAMSDFNAMLPSKYFCAPDGVTVGQMQDVVVKYLTDHPAFREISFILLATEALTTAFPCRHGALPRK